MCWLPNVEGALIILLAILALAVDHGIPRRISAWLDHSVYRGPADRSVVALTFDDGPCLQTTELLAYLHQEGVQATFFLLGLQLERFPEIAQQVYAEGHEIGNHAWSHTRLSPTWQNGFHLPSPWWMRQELTRTQQRLTELCGTAPTLFRPPYGARWFALDAIQRKLGLRGIQWTVIGHDWEWPAERVATHILAQVKPGAIICLHDGRDTRLDADISETLKAVKLLVPALRERGYSFATVSKLLEPLAGTERHRLQ